MSNNAVLNVFIIVIVAGAVLFSLFGGQLTALSEYLKAFSLFGVFTAIFIIVLSFKIKTHIELRDQGRLGEILVFLTQKQIFKDYLVNIAIIFIMLVVPLLDRYIGLEDAIQTIGAAVLYFIWHRMIFRKKQAAIDAVSLNNSDQIMDELVIFFMPVFIFIIAAAIASIDIIDFIQAAVVFMVLFVWHKILFSH